MGDRLVGRPSWAGHDSGRRRRPRHRWAFGLLALTTAAGPAPLRVVPAAHYTIRTDVDDAALVADLARRLDAMYDEYGRQLPDIRPRPDAPPLAVYLFAHHDRYLTFSRYGGPNTGGVFVAGPHPYLATYVDGQSRDDLRRTLQHEGFHQFAYAAVSRHLPIWLNEGLAQVFEEELWTGRGFLTEQVPPGRVRQLESDVHRGTATPIDKLIAITPQAWADTLHRDATAGETNYNQAWAFVHFLSFAADADTRQRWRDLLGRLHDLDRRGRSNDAAAAFHACFPDPTRLESAFATWSQQVRPTDAATLVEHQKVLADFLIEFHKVGRTFPTVAAFRAEAVRQHERITYARGFVRYTTDADPGVYFADLAGRPYTAEQLRFESATGAPLPDIVCQTQTFRVRRHFVKEASGSIDHEGTVEATDAP